MLKWLPLIVVLATSWMSPLSSTTSPAPPAAQGTNSNRSTGNVMFVTDVFSACAAVTLTKPTTAQTTSTASVHLTLEPPPSLRAWSYGFAHVIERSCSPPFPPSFQLGPRRACREGCRHACRITRPLLRARCYRHDTTSSRRSSADTPRAATSTPQPSRSDFRHGRAGDHPLPGM